MTRTVGVVDDEISEIVRGYTAPNETRFGQVHYLEAGAANESRTPLYCLHATAYSGETFVPLMRLMARNRRVVALDTPGYGSSASPGEQVDISQYAHAIAEAIRATQKASENRKPVDIFGYHTGALIAIELAVLYPELVNRMVLNGIPFFEGSDAIEWRRKLVHETTLGESFDQFRHRWDYFVTQRASAMPLARAFQNFVDELRSYPRDWWAHKALFEYDARNRLPLVKSRVRVINIGSPLSVFSSNAAALMPLASVVELTEVKQAPLDTGVGLLAPLITDFLDAKEFSRVVG